MKTSHRLLRAFGAAALAALFLSVVGCSGPLAQNSSHNPPLSAGVGPGSHSGVNSSPSAADEAGHVGPAGSR